MLLADVLEKFENNSLKNYGLCPSHYLSAPGLSWDAMLKMTKIELILILDPDIYILFEKAKETKFLNKNPESKLRIKTYCVLKCK